MSDASQQTAVVYARVSTAKQAEEQLPIAGQIEQCEAKAWQLGARVVRVFRDDGISGAAESRPAFEAALDYACSQGASYFVVWSSSRFGRDRVRAAMAKRELDRAGVRLVYCTMDVDTDTTGGWLLDSMLEVFDEMQSRQVAADTRRSMERNARQGYFTGGTIPYGFCSVPASDDPKRRSLVPEPSEADVVRTIYEWALQDGAVNIAAHLNREGLFYRRGQKWTRQGVLGVLKSRAVIGQIVFNRKDRRTGRVRPPEQWIVIDSHEPIVDRELWERVRARMEASADECRHGSSRSTHVFTGLLRCGKCGARMQAESAKGRSRRYWYYNCSAATMKKAHRARRLPADDLDAWLINTICAEVLNRDNLTEVITELRGCIDQWEKEHSERRRSRVAQLRRTEDKVGKLYDVLELHGRDAPNLGDLTQRLRQHKARQEDLEREIASIDAEGPPEIAVSDDEVEMLAASMRELLHDASPQRARAFFRDFIEQIVVEDDHLRIAYRPERLVAVPRASVWLPGADARGTRELRVELAERFRRAA